MKVLKWNRSNGHVVQIFPSNHCNSHETKPAICFVFDPCWPNVIRVHVYFVVNKTVSEASFALCQ